MPRRKTKTTAILTESHEIKTKSRDPNSNLEPSHYCKNTNERRPFEIRTNYKSRYRQPLVRILQKYMSSYSGVGVAPGGGRSRKWVEVVGCFCVGRGVS